jgi:membrane-bound metal-dependent hydrolase YbcI (DUF457 family)
MPSPVGHALAGLATAWIADALVPALRRPTRGNQPAAISEGAIGALALGCAVVAAAPDLDILTGSHRALSHSVGAAVIVGLVAGILFARRWRLAAGGAVGLCTTAYGTHLLLDWLARDATSPRGIMALWPGSPAYYTSGVGLFFEVSRRYWDPREFIVGNLGSVVWELALLGPLAGAAWWLSARARRSRSQGARVRSGGPPGC